jgi:hypothetical protein
LRKLQFSAKQVARANFRRKTQLHKKMTNSKIHIASTFAFADSMRAQDEQDIARCETEIGERERMIEADLIVESLREQAEDESECDCDEVGCPECDERNHYAGTDQNDEQEPGDGMTDGEADADTLASAGYGTDEDYGCFSE